MFFLQHHVTIFWRDRAKHACCNETMNMTIPIQRDELKPNFIEALLLGKEIIILGEMNSNLLKTYSYEAQVLSDFNDPTRITSQTSSLIDVIIMISSSSIWLK